MGDEVVKTKDELLAEMKVATDAGDWKAVSKVSSQIAKVVAGEEKEEKEARTKLIAEYQIGIQRTLEKTVDKWIETLPEDVLPVVDGVWFSYDFGEKLTVVRLTKGAIRKAGGGGGGKKFNITTNELLGKHGSEMMGDTGKTFQQAYEADTGGNARYNVRMKLLKVEYPSS